MFDVDKQDAVNKEHRLHPKPGDYWEEHLCGVLVVLDVTDELVTICQHRKDMPKNRWTWDLDRFEELTRTEFEQKLLYKGSKPGSVTYGKTWAHCHPGAHGWAVQVHAQRVVDQPYSEEELIKRAIRNAVKPVGAERWVRVKRAFGTGSSVAVAICTKYGFDPDATN